jgi:hypothetical protein
MVHLFGIVEKLEINILRHFDLGESKKWHTYWNGVINFF